MDRARSKAHERPIGPADGQTVRAPPRQESGRGSPGIAAGSSRIRGHPPRQTEADVQAPDEGWVRSDVDRDFRLDHWEYDRERIDGYDYDIDAVLIKSAEAPDESELITVLNTWSADLFGLGQRRSQVVDVQFRGAVSSYRGVAGRRSRWGSGPPYSAVEQAKRGR